MARSTHYLLTEILNVKTGETVAIYSDTESDVRLVNAIANEVQAMKAIPVVIRMHANHDQNFEYPGPVRFLLRTADVVLELGRGSIIAYTSTHREITSAGRARFMSLVNINSESFVSAIDEDNYGKILHLGSLIVKLSDHHCREIRITTRGGTEILASMNRGRAWQYNGIATNPGEEASLAGQVWWVPDERTINGELVVDGSVEMPQVVIPKTPIHISVIRGSISSIEGGREAAKFSKYLQSFGDKNVYRIAHLTMGINSGILAPSQNCAITNERVFGSFVFGFGSQGEYGSRFRAPIHGDLVVLRSSLWLDGIRIEKEGKLVHPSLRQASKMLDTAASRRPIGHG